MSYYSIGNSNAIGGGSLAKTEKLPSLKLRCLDLCARHVDRLGNLGDMPTEMFIDLLQRAKYKATPEVVQRLQDENERLMCKEVDRAYWKQAVEGHILRRAVIAPGPVLVKRIKEHKETLSYFQEIEKSERTDAWARDVMVELKGLEDIPASVGLLQQTMIGKVVGPLRKAADAGVARNAAALIARWKEAAAIAQQLQQRQEEGGKADASKTNAFPAKARGSETKSFRGAKGSAASTCGMSPDSAGGLQERNPVEEKQRAVEAGFRCRTWHSLYWHLEMMREEKVKVSSKRAREARERELQKKPKMIMGKSKGEDFLSRREDKKLGRRTAMSMVPPSSISSSTSGGRYDSSPPKPASSRGNGFFNGSGSSRGKSSSSGKGSSKGETSSVKELRRNVVIGQLLSRPMMEPGKKRAGGVGMPPIAKKSKFWQ